MSGPGNLRRHAFAITAVLVGVAFVAACGAPATTNQTPTTADQSSGAPAAQSTAIAASTPTPVPTPQLLDACKLLAPEDVAAVRGPGAQAATSYVALLPSFNFAGGAPIPAPSGVSCTYEIKLSADSSGGAMTLQLCRCNASSAEFDTWAMKPDVIGNSGSTQPPLSIPAVGERAYLLPGGGGIVFRQSGVDFVLRAFGRNLPDLQQTTGAVDPRFGRPSLAEPELTSKATVLFSALAAKVLGRLAASPAAAPSVVPCSAGTPTITIPAGFAFNNCNAQTGETAYTWCPTGGGGACLSLRRQPFGGSHLGNSVVVDVGGKVGYLVAEKDSTTVGWYDGGITWYLRLFGTQLSKEAIIGIAGSVRPEMIASAPLQTAPTSVSSTTGRCATTPTVTLPASFTFVNCREQASTATFTWQGGTDGAVALGVLPVGSNVSNPGGTAADINGNPGTIGTTIVVWSDSKGTYYASAGGSYFTRDALLAFARSVR